MGPMSMVCSTADVGHGRYGRSDGFRGRPPDGVLLLHHAIAPGFGDPAGFRIDDCSIQRNLSEEGRQPAIAIGTWLRARGISRAKVYSS